MCREMPAFAANCRPLEANYSSFFDFASSFEPELGLALDSSAKDSATDRCAGVRIPCGLSVLPE